MSDITLELNQSLAVVTLNRPERMNAFNVEMAQELEAVFTAIAANPQVRAVLLKAEGRYFTAGGNLPDFAEYVGHDATLDNAPFNQLIGRIHNAITIMTTLPAPIIACVQGGAAGIGISILAACDIVLAEENSVYSTGYLALGATPDGGSTWFLPRLMGERKARELLMLCDRFNGQEAQQLGLVNRLHSKDVLADEALALATRLANGPTLAYGGLKKLLAQAQNSMLSEHLDAERKSFMTLSQSDDFKEGIRAFSNKEKPQFNGK